MQPRTGCITVRLCTHRETTEMKSYLKDTIEWIAQKLIVAASSRAVEMISDASERDEVPKALPAPRLPQIELH
jgi:hypothetical protein